MFASPNHDLDLNTMQLNSMESIHHHLYLFISVENDDCASLKEKFDLDQAIQVHLLFVYLSFILLEAFSLVTS